MKASVFMVALVVAIGISCDAAAQPTFTVSGGINHSTVDTVYLGADTTITDDFSGPGPRIAFDVGFGPWRTFQVGWSRFGSNNGTFYAPPMCPGVRPCPVGPREDDTHPIEQTGSALWAAYTPTVRRQQLELFGKLGAARVVSRTGGDPVGSLEESGTELMIGFGAAYWFSDRVGMRADAERLGDAASQFGISVAFRF